MCDDQTGQLDPSKISIMAAGGKVIDGAMCAAECYVMYDDFVRSG